MIGQFVTTRVELQHRAWRIVSDWLLRVQRHVADKVDGFCKLGLKLRLGKVWGHCNGVIESYAVRRLEGEGIKGDGLDGEVEISAPKSNSHQQLPLHSTNTTLQLPKTSLTTIQTPPTPATKFTATLGLVLTVNQAIAQNFNHNPHQQRRIPRHIHKHHHQKCRPSSLPSPKRQRPTTPASTLPTQPTMSPHPRLQQPQLPLLPANPSTPPPATTLPPPRSQTLRGPPSRKQLVSTTRA